VDGVRRGSLLVRHSREVRTSVDTTTFRIHSRGLCLRVDASSRDRRARRQHHRPPPHARPATAPSQSANFEAPIVSRSRVQLAFWWGHHAYSWRCFAHNSLQRTPPTSRTPLTKLRTELELILERHEDSDESLHLGRLVERTEGLTLLVDRLLVLASPHAALKSPTLVSLAAAVETLASDLEPGRIEISVGDDGMVLSDAAVLSAMVRNALENALKFSPGIVHVSVAQEGSHLLLRVDDTGPEMPPEQRARVFERFARGSNQHAGHGIGLALIAHIVAAHDGTVRFVDGPGAHLEIHLPKHTRE
jgi:hypothetical protein